MDHFFFIGCITCNKEIQRGIWNSQFYPNLFTMLSAFIALTIIVAVLGVLSARRYTRRKLVSRVVILDPTPLSTASMVLGIGLGGFLDGIILHQVLQWHEMLSNKVPATNYIGKSVNMFWDGVFHFFCLVVVVIGVVLLWRLLKRSDIDTSGKLLGGGLLAGWGIFNIVEGLIDHHFLKLHNVMEFAANHDFANYTFLVASIIMIIAGFAIMNSSSRKTDAVPLNK